MKKILISEKLLSKTQKEYIEIMTFFQENEIVKTYKMACELFNYSYRTFKKYNGKLEHYNKEWYIIDYELLNKTQKEFFNVEQFAIDNPSLSLLKICEYQHYSIATYGKYKNRLKIMK